MGPPTVPQDEQLQIIGELEELHSALQDVNAEVSTQLTEKLRRLRRSIQTAPTPQARERAWGVMKELLRMAAAELIRRMLETSISNHPATRLRERSYTDDVGRRVHQDSARVRWAQAA